MSTWMEQTGLGEVDVAGDPLFGGLAADAGESPAEELFRRCVSAAGRLHAGGQPITGETIALHDRAVPREQASLVVRTVRFRQAMLEQGIEFMRTGLSPEQQLFIQTYFAPEMWLKSEAAILKLAGVHRQRFLGWMKDPVFRAEFDQWREDVFDASKSKAMTALQAKAEAGDVPAIKLVMAMTHRYDPEGQAAEYHRMLSVLLSIIDEELRGPQFEGVMKRLGRRVQDAIPGLGQMLQQSPAQIEAARTWESLPQRPLTEEASTVPPADAGHPTPEFAPLAEILGEEPAPPPAGDGQAASLSGEWQVDLSRPNRNRPVD